MVSFSPLLSIVTLEPPAELEADLSAAAMALIWVTLLLERWARL